MAHTTLEHCSSCCSLKNESLRQQHGCTSETDVASARQCQKRQHDSANSGTFIRIEWSPSDGVQGPLVLQVVQSSLEPSLVTFFHANPVCVRRNIFVFCMNLKALALSILYPPTKPAGFFLVWHLPCPVPA